MEPAKTLIDLAAEVCGSRYALAKRLDVDESSLGKMAKGSMPIPPRLAPRLADIAGLDPAKAACVAIIESARTEKEREELIKVFSRAGVAAMLAFCIVGGLLMPSPATAANVPSDITGNNTQYSLYIM